MTSRLGADLHMKHSEDNKRIAKNTMYLYLRSLFTMVLSLYTSRLILQVLGFTDYGIYNLIGSVVVMFNMFSATFVASTQRFLNFVLGKRDIEGAAKVFSASVNIHAILAVCIVILLETVGLWFLNYKLNIPAGRMVAANIVYQYSVFTFVVNLFCIPYNAVIVAKEKMQIFAMVNVSESILKLLIVLFLSLVSFDRLIIYGILLPLVPCSVFVFYRLYCGKRYKECQYIKVNDILLYKEMIGISGWNFLGSGATIATVAGMGIIINMFTNVVVNSAKGIASQIETIVKQLVDNFMISVRPQITKSYAWGDYQYLQLLISRGSRFSLYLMSALCFPIILNVDYILKLWLGNVPEYTAEFVIIALIYILVIPFSNILDNVLMATGKIKYSQIYLSLLQLCNLPLSCLVLYLEYPPYLIYLSYIFMSYMSLIVRIYYSMKYAEIKATDYIINVLLKPISVITLSFLAAFIIKSQIHFSYEFIQCIVSCIITEGSLLVCCFLLGVNRSERVYLCNIFKSIFVR